MEKGEASQAAVTSSATRFTLFLVLHCSASEHARAVGAACAALPQLARRMAASFPATRLAAAVGFGSSFWDAVASGPRPAELRPFAPVAAAPLRAPATGGDVFVHIKSSRMDLNLDLARALLDTLEGKVRTGEEVHGFTYRDSRDLTGFIDGTANPRGRARARAALIGQEDPHFRGGSYVLAQRYVHDLKAWAALTVSQQEAIIGRRKRDSKELAQAPDTAHIRRAELKVGAEELPILRQSMPYGDAGGELGLYFVAYARDPGRFERMLQRMLGAAGDGRHDRLMEFTRPVSGAFFFVPSLGVLKRLA
jgi:putative iron-dependent peroxidase